MNDKNPIQKYYNQLAPEYDKDRFNNTYGQYLHFQERQILSSRLGQIPKNFILDLGCGTGRFLDFAANGVDFSAGMLQQAKEKYPNHKLTVSDISQMPFDDHSFEAIFSLHVFMHLEMKTIRATIQEAHRILKKDGIFIFDFPSKARRQLINYQKQGWHGNTPLDLNQVKHLIEDKFEIEGYQGILFFPIHRIPKQLRFLFRPLDTLLGKSFFKKWASYHFVFLRKK